MARFKDKLMQLKRRPLTPMIKTHDEMQRHIDKKLGPGYKFVGMSDRGIEVERVVPTLKVDKQLSAYMEHAWALPAVSINDVMMEKMQERITNLPAVQITIPLNEKGEAVFNNAHYTLEENNS